MKLFVVVLVTLFGASLQADEVCNSDACKAIAKEYTSYMRPEVSPCEDFYEYACGNFPKVHPITPQEGRLLSFTFRENSVVHEVDAAIHAADSSKSNTVRFLSELYQECNASAVLNARGEAPLINTIDEVVGDWPLLGRSSGKQREIFDIFVDSYTKLSFLPLFRLGAQYVPSLKKNMLYLLPGATAMPANVIKSLHANPDLEEAYEKFMRQAAIELGAKDNAELTKEIKETIALEIKLAGLEDPFGSLFNRLDTLATLNIQTGEVVDWIKVLNTVLKRVKSTAPQFQASDQVIVSDTKYIEDAIEVLKATPRRKLQNLLAWGIVVNFGAFTTDKLRNIEYDFAATLRGSRTNQPHWRLCYSIANSRLPFALSRVYVDAHFTAQDKKEATVLVEEIKSSFKNIMSKETWLDSQTQALALEKLAAIKENVAYGEWMVNDKELDKYYEFLNNHKVYKGKFFESVLELQSGLIREQFDTLHRPVNHTYLWPMTPATVNAAYFPVENSITIPAAVLKSPFFDKERPIALNYGSIGAIIGHELTHGFDTIGSRFDKDGNRKNWWTSKTLAQFNNKTHCFVEQYSKNIEPTTHMHLNGRQSVSEDIADNGGLKEAFYAMQSHQTKYGKSKLLPGIKMNADQLYFLGYANNWCSNVRADITKNQIRTNPHTPERFRVNVPLQNSEEFAKAFQCKVGSKMAPTQRCSLW